MRPINSFSKGLSLDIKNRNIGIKITKLKGSLCEKATNAEDIAARSKVERVTNKKPQAKHTD